MTAAVLACTAEAWGYGPAAKLLAIARRIPAMREAFTSGTALVFAQTNRVHYDRTVPLANPLEILQHPIQADHVLNVMDPCAALWARRNGVPTTYVDSLHWFWRWSAEEYDDLVHEADAMLRMTSTELGRRLRNVDWHRMVPLAYLWSDQVFLQRIGPPAARMRVFGDRVRYCGAIVDVEPSVASSLRSGGIISLSGGVSHVGTVSSADVYAAVVQRMLSDVPADLVPAGILGHPAVTTAGGTRRVRPSLDRDAMRAAQSTARFMLAPAGLTTALEAAAAGVALGFLPEQHGGHLANAQLLRDGDETLYPGAMLSQRLEVTDQDPATFIARLTTRYRRLLGQDEGVMPAIQKETRQMVTQLADPDEAAALAGRQRRRIEDLTGGFDGAQLIADAVAAKLGIERCRP